MGKKQTMYAPERPPAFSDSLVDSAGCFTGWSCGGSGDVIIVFWICIALACLLNLMHMGCLLSPIATQENRLFDIISMGSTATVVHAIIELGIEGKSEASRVDDCNGL